LLCLTKADLAPPDDILAVYEPLGFAYIVTSRPFTDGVLDDLHGRLAARESVLIGHSGVGKSTLVNALIPAAGRVVGVVNPVTGRGRHTSSSAIALPLGGRDGGWVIDTPGLRSFGLGHVSPDRVLSAFPDLAEAAARCQPGCIHLDDCALDDWAREHGGEARLDSLRRLLRSRDGADT
jgi:ribosome biogenesis GTPase / thiamine phosphate phosphatase